MASGDTRLTVAVLGPLGVRDAAGRDVTPAGVLQRRLLALLVLRRGEVVSTDTAIDALWPADPPRDAVAALQNHLSRLRRALPGVIESVGAGYRLDPARIHLDIDRLPALLAADVGDPATRSELAGLLRRWQGPAYPELEDTDVGRAEAVHLEELRIRAMELLAEARLAAGDLDGLVADLLALVDREPLRERPRALLLSTLAAGGRTVEALRVYDDFRRLLADQLGIEPSPALAAQHTALLEHTAPARSAAIKTRLPVPATTLVGRDALLGELLALVGTTRAVTMVGPGGIGKTRLLVEVGLRLTAARPDRPVVLCELAAADAATMAEVVASALGIDARPGIPTTERVVEVLGEHELVLLVDNCEHVLDGAADMVERILRGCPRVTVLATSRERLRVAGEHVRPVPALAIDDGDAAAIDLFVQRARAVQPGFDPDRDEEACVAEIVRRLDGLPLAIELAAARLHTLDVTEVAAGLDRPLSLLSAGYRTTSRHSSLAAVVSWSYGLLDDELQRTFAALSAFAGSFSALDAAAVCDLDVDRAGDLLARLVERSLVVRAPRRRYALLETLRAFAAEQLVTSGRAELVGERHARRLVEWAEDAERRLHVPGEPVLAEIDEAIPEVRTAVGWFLDHGRVEEAGRLVAALVNYALLRLRADVLTWAERVLAADPEDRSPMASRLWAAAAYLSWMAGDLTEAGARVATAVELAEAGHAMSQVVATMRGNHDLFQGQLPAAAAWYHRAVEAAGDDDGARLIAMGAEILALGYAANPRATELADAVLRELGDAETAPAAYLWYCAGEADLLVDRDRALTRLGRAVEMAEATHASFVRGLAGASKASIEARFGDPAVAAGDYRWLIPHWQRAGMWSTQWTMLRSIVGLLERLGRHREAAVLEGAVRNPAAGHRIFGADAVALREIGARLRAALGAEAYEAARREGAALDGDAAVEHALRSL